MELTRAEGERLAREGMAALRAGDAATAHAALIQLKDGAPGIPAPWLLIAQAAERLGRDGEAEEAVSRYLKDEPRHLGALLMIAALKARGRDERAAMAYYKTALGVAALPTTTVSPVLAPMLREGEAFLAAANARFTAHLEQAIATPGLAKRAEGARVREALDLLLGRRELYLQQPSMFYFPGLPQRAFFERDEFAWLTAVETETAAMREEALAAMKDGFVPYVQTAPDRPPASNLLRDDPSWSAYYLWQGGEIVAKHADRCPATMRALEHAPIPVIKGRSPMAIYSLLKPGTHIQPHHGMLNTRLICHVPLIAPDGCALRVGSETRTWRQGEALIFDDSFEHEAWNRGGETRVVLLFEIWRPEISADERAALTEMFEAIDTYQGVAIDQG